MKKFLFLLLFGLCGIVWAQAQTTILDFEAAPTTTLFRYFESSLDGTFNQNLPNPNPSGINTSATVAEHIKPTVAQTYAGGITDPSPMTSITTNGSLIKVKVLMDHIGNVAIKLESPGLPNWIKIVPNTVANQWEEIVFDTNLNSDENPMQPATGTYDNLAIFFDFGTGNPPAQIVSYFDDITVTGGGPPPTFPVDFAVDMNNHTGAFTTVYVSGTFNGWSADANPLSDPDGDGVWTGTVQLAAGNYEFKYQVDQWAGEETLTPGSTCTVTASGFTNRTLAVTGALNQATVCYGSCTACGVSSNFQVDFVVDMNNYTGTFTTVYVSGSFNGWSGNANPLSDPDGDGVWTGSAMMPAGAYEYKFQVDQWAGEETLTPGSTCTVTTGAFTNRTLNVTAFTPLPAVCWESCSACTPPMDNVDFSVDMNNYATPFTTVYVSGTFNGWSGTANPLSDPDGDGVWTATIPLPAGAHEFKYSHDDWTGQENLAPGGSCVLTTNGFTNRLINVAGPMSIPTVCWESCMACTSGTPVITFSVDMNNYTGPFTTVFVSGNFNGWSGNANPLSDSDGDGVWTADIPLAAGNYEYKFQVDEWAAQENLAVGSGCTITTGGFTNRLVAVTTTATLATVCWESCVACTAVPPMVTFQVDMTAYTAPFTTVYVSGSFNGWNGVVNPLSDTDGDGIWTGVYPIPAGTHEFKFTIDDWTDQEQFPVGASCTVTNSGFTNRLLSVAGDMTYPLNCFSACVDCASLPPFVSFSVDMNNYAGAFTTVYVSGTLNSWSGDANPLSDADGDGIWTGDIRVPVGFHEFKISLDNWANSEQFNGTEECTITTGGFTNRQFDQIAGGLTIPTFCYNSCYACGDEVLMTFRLGMGGVTASPDGVWLSGGGNFGDPGGLYKMNGPDANGVYELTVPRQTGFSSYFAFANGACPDYSCKEDISGLPCANPGNFNDRFMPAVMSNVVYETCFGQCSDNVACTYPALVPSVAHTNVSCNGGTNGTITLAMSGGSTIYNYNWGGGITTANRTGLMAGSYTVTVTDGVSGLTVTETVVVTQPTAMAITTSATDVTCFGLSTGLLSANTTGGTAGYSYAWSNGVNAAANPNIPAGTYTVTVTDANMCTMVKSTTIAQPTLLRATVTASHVDCFGNNTGSAQLTAVGGTVNYSYAWSNGTSMASNPGLPAGTYTATITDARNCTVVATTTINQPAALTAAVSGTNINCFGDATGAAVLAVNGGTTNYTYAWSNGNTMASNTGLVAGTYDVTITDAKLCTTTASQTLTEPAEALSVTADIAYIDCFGGATGYISLNPEGGTPAYTYAWSTGTQTTFDLYDLPAGTYSATVTDFNNCTATYTETLIQPAAPLALSATVVDAPCGNATGSVSIAATGGTAGYNFLWSTGATTSSIDNLAAGTYTVTVSDFYACSMMLSSTVAATGNVITTSVSSTDVGCFGESTGTATVNPSGGSMPYNFAWSNGSTDQNQSALAAGTYTVTITDNDGCSTTSTATVAEPTALAATATATNVSCNGASDGTVALAVMGGTATYTYAWASGQTTETLAGVAAGAYSVVVTDANNCTTTAMVTITAPTALVCTTTKTPITAVGANDGTATATVSGGTPGYMFLWSNGATTQSITDLAPGAYSVVVTDLNGCTVTRNVTIANFNCTFAPTASATNVSCFGANDGTAMVDLQGGSTPAVFAWSTGETTAMVTGLSAGAYTITVEDADGCEEILNIDITEPTALVVTATATGISANGLMDGTATASAAGGTSTYSYAWSNGATGATISGLAAGTYTVTATDANNCTSTQSVIVEDFACAFAPAIAAVNVSCFGAADGTAGVALIGATDPVMYAWSNGETTQAIMGLAAGTYSVVVTDASNCSASLSVDVLEPTAVVANASATALTSNGSNDATATANPTGGAGNYSYAWSTGSTNQMISGLAPGTYTVTISDDNACTATESVTISTFACAISATVSGENVTCAGAANGAAIVATLGGNGATTYLWSNGATTDVISGLSAGTFTVTVTDASNCAVSQSTTITAPTAVQLTASATGVSSLGATDGTASATATGGTGVFTYTWDNGATGALITGLAEGTYVVTASDENACTQTSTVVVSSVNCAVSSSTNSTNVSCFGAADGTASVTVLGATDPLTFMWSNGETTASISGLGAGTYTYAFEDAMGCPGTGSVTITEPTAVQATVTTVVDVQCMNATGSITIAASGGTGTLTYLWSDGQMASTAQNLDAGMYSVVVSDANNCSVELTDIEVLNSDTEAPALMALTEITVSLNASGLASINETTLGVVATDNCGNVDIQISTTTFDCTTTGAHIVTITATDASGNTSTSTVNVTVEDASVPVLLCPLDMVLCSDDATVTFVDPVLMDNCATTVTQTSGLVSGDVYPVGVTTQSYTTVDASGNTATCAFTVEVTAPLEANGSITDVACFGDCNGSITLDAMGGTAPYTYDWTGNPDLTALCAGTYDLVLVDALGCSMTESYEINQAGALGYSVNSVTNDIGNQGIGSITIDPIGGNAPFTAEWTDADGNAVGTGLTITGLMMGTYFVQITDANGCFTDGLGIIVENTVSSDEPAWMQSVALSPNPTAGQLFINFSELPQSEIKISVMDMAGKLIQNGIFNTKQVELDLSAYASGVYLIRISDAKSSGVRKIIVE